MNLNIDTDVGVEFEITGQKAKLRDKRLAKHRTNQIRNEQIKEELNDYGNDRSA